MVLGPTIVMAYIRVGVNYSYSLKIDVSLNLQFRIYGYLDG